MTMNNIEKISLIKKENLSNEFYLRSLMDEASRLSLIGDDTMQRIQFDCLSLLAEKSLAFYGGESGSIRIEAAENILHSIMFTIGAALKKEDTPAEALSQLCTQGTYKIYEAGRKRIDIRIKATKQLHKMVIGNMLTTKNYTYNSTLIGGIDGFFKLYNPEYSAHEIHITADYPTVNPITDLAGIEFIGKYLESIYYENMFCSRFSAEKIHYMMNGYMKGYSELVINLFSFVLTNVTGCILLHKSPYVLDITKEETKHLAHYLENMERKQLSHKVLLAYHTMCFEMDITNDALKEYIESALHIITSNIFLAIQNGTLDKVFLEFT